jgi:hypothetical protein
MRKIIFLLVANLLLFFSITSANDISPQGQLQVIVIAPGSHDFVKEWEGSSYGHAPHIDSVKEVKRGQMFSVAIIVSGFSTDSNGQTDLEGDFIFINPDGKETDNNKNTFRHKSDMKVRSGGFVMLEPLLDMTLDETDMLGAYTIKAVVRDKVLKTAGAGEYKINLVEGSGNKLLQAHFDSLEDFSKWVTYYYIQPEPKKLQAALKFYTGSPIFDKTNTRMPTAVFFASILRNNNGLMEEVYKEVSSRGSVNAKAMLLKILWLVNNTESKQFIDKAKIGWAASQLSDDFKAISITSAPDISNGEINDPGQLDMFWAAFMATGDRLAIKKIISALRLLKSNNGLDIAIGGAAKWSLTSSAIQHQRVYEICKEELNSAEGQTKIILQDIVAEVDAERNKGNKGE